MSKVDIISGSEVDSRLSCERKHYYAFGQPVQVGGVETHGIEPLEHGQALTRGTFGHGVLEQYYEAVRQGFSHGEAKHIAITYASKKIAEVSTDVEKAKMFSDNLSLILKYLEFYDWEVTQKKIKVIAVEHEFRYDVPGTDLVFPFKPDAIIQDRETGKVFIWDHKFLYNFYTDRTLPIMPQLVRYGYALQEMGYRVDGAMYNMLSTRNNSRDPFRRMEKIFNKNAEKQFWAENVSTMLQIRELKQGPNAAWEAGARRTASDFNCKNCSFLDLCISDLNGNRGRQLMINNFYKPNSYGYGKEDLEP